jgi:hypothetical protein
MRRRLIPAAIACVVAVAAAGCSSAAAPPSPPPACAATTHIGAPLGLRLKTPPSRAQAICVARRYSAVFAVASGWGRVPSVMRAENQNLQLWDEVSLLYACTSNCRYSVFTLSWVRANNPEWIVRDTEGLEIHPVGRPDLTLLDFTNLDYLAAWSIRIIHRLSTSGFTGVDVVDAANNQKWDGEPVTHNEDVRHVILEGAVLRRQIAKALSITRAPLLQAGFLLAAENGPPTVVAPTQINSTDAVSVGEGFARRTAASWNALFRYFHRAFTERVAPIVWDDEPHLTHAQRVFGLASYYLIAVTPVSAYGVGPDSSDPLYRIALGANDASSPTQVDGVWVRTYSGGTVAVNPQPTPESVKLGTRTVILPPMSAAIRVGKRVLLGE